MRTGSAMSVSVGIRIAAPKNSGVKISEKVQGPTNQTSESQTTAQLETRKADIPRCKGSCAMPEHMLKRSFCPMPNLDGTT